MGKVMRKQFANFVEFSVDEMHHIGQQLKEFHFFVLFFIRAIFKLYICIPTNCTQLIYFINNTLKHMYCLKL